MFKVISDFNILDFDPILGDIHSPVSLSLCTKGQFDSLPLDESDDENCEVNTLIKPRWIRENAQTFTEFIDMNLVADLICKLDDVDPLSVDNAVVNRLVDDCNSIIIIVAEKADMMFEITNRSHRTPTQKMK
jgi:hypothetical protein